MEATSDKDAAGSAIGVWHIVGLAIVVVGIIVLVLLVRSDFNEDRDTVTGVLGVVVPAFATIGAALFGVTLGYSTGKESGKASGKAAAAADKEQAVDAAKKAVVKEVKSRLQGADKAVSSLHQQITTELESPAGQHAFTLRAGAAGPAVEIGVDDLHGAKRGVEDALRRCDEILES